MPREVDRYRRLTQITNNPLNTITAGNLQKLIAQPGPDTQKILDDGFQEAVNNILKWIDSGTGLDLLGWAEILEGTYPGEADILTNFTTALQQTFANLAASLQQSWLNFQNLLNGIIQETDAEVAAVITYLRTAGEDASAAWTQIENFITTGDWADLTTAWNDLMQGIFGSSTSLGLVGQIPAPAVVNVTQNLQPVWDFPDATSVREGGGWSWDGTVDHTGVTGSGSAKFMCSGALGALRGIPGAVQPAQTVTPLGYVTWSGLTAAGGTSPIQLELIPYSGAGSTLSAGTPVTIASITSPGASSSTYAGAVLVGGRWWVPLTDTYTVPSSGVTAVQLRPVVTADATAGTVNWDDCQCDVSGGFLADMKSAQTDVINSLSPGGTAAEFVTGIQNLLALFGLSKSTLGSATDLTAFWTAIVTDFINPLNALEISAVNGLASSLSALLGTTTFQTLLDSVANALGHSGTGHTITNIETYLGLIPPANVTNVLGGANLGADVSSVQTQASTQNTWWGQLMTDVSIYLDLFHVTYPAGSPSDGPTTTIGGVRTWYSAIADILALFGVVHSTSAPTTPAADVGTAATAAQAAATTAQDTADGASSDAGSALDQLTAVPQQNVVPLEVATGQPVALVASGAGNTGTGVGSLSVSWTDTVPSTANYLIVTANTATTHGGIARAYVNGIQMSSISTVSYASSGVVTLFGLANPPVGSVTFRVDTRDSSSLFSMTSGTSMSFSNVASISPVAFSNAVGASPSLSTSFSSSQLVVNVIGTFGTGGSAVGLSSYNRTSRYHAGNFNGGSQFNMDLIAGTVSGVSSPSFTASVANTTNEGYAAIAVAVNPPPNILGSYARAYRSTASGVVTGVATDHVFAQTICDTSVNSSDITVDLSTNKFTVSYSGTYLFKVGVAFTGVFSTQVVDALCYVNGALFERSAQFWYASSNQTRLAWSTPVYLNAGDYVQPGMTWASSSTITFVGESTGSQTYMSLSLMNRSLL